MKFTKVNYSFLLFLLFFSCSQKNTPETNNSTTEVAKTSAVIDANAIQRIDSTLNQFVASGNIAGVSALVFEKGEEVYFNAFGHADRENEVAMDRNTIVQIYSMTKPITSVALMKLHEQGKFKLDDPLSKYAPEFENMKVFVGVDSSDSEDIMLESAHRPITIRDLTRHTAGFANGTQVRGLSELHQDADVLNIENSLSQMAEKLGSLPLWFHPGKQWAYGISVDVQAFLVERISGVPFDQYLQENIFNPLKLSETRYFVPEKDRNRMAGVYRRTEEGKLSRIPNETIHRFNTQKWTLTPGGWGLTSTLDDYMRFARMLVNEGELEDVRILESETVQLMASNHLADSVEERSWLPGKGQVGFGINFAVRTKEPANKEENYGEVGEFFWDGAASTLFWVDPKNEITAVLFVQLFPYDQIGLHKKFRDAVYGKNL